MTEKYIRGRGRSGPFHKIQMRRAVTAAVLLVCLLFAVPAAEDTVTVSTFDELKDNISTASDSGEMRTIVIEANIPVGTGDAIPAITSGKNITLTTFSDKDYKIYRTGGNTTSATGMFTVAGGNLTICNNDTHTLTLDGNKTTLTNNEQSLVYVRSGTFKMNNTATVDADNDVYLPDTKKIEVTAGMKPEGGAWNITPEVETSGTVVVSVTYSGGTAEGVRPYFKLKPSLRLNLVANGTKLIIAQLPEVDADTVTFVPYNSTVATVSFNLTAVDKATEVYVNLTNVSSGTTVNNDGKN